MTEYSSPCRRTAHGMFSLAQDAARWKALAARGRSAREWLYPAAALFLLLACPSWSFKAALVMGQQKTTSSAEPQQGLTLPVAVEIALRSSPLIRATQSGQKLADGQVREARASRAPILQFNETYTNSNNPVFVFGSLLEQGRFGSQNFALNSLNNPASLSNFRSALTLRAPLFNQLRTETSISQARLGRRQADEQQRLAEEQIRIQVIVSYYGVLVAEARKSVAEDAVKTAEADVKRMGDMRDMGLVVQSDLLAAEVQLAEFRQQLIQAEGDLTTAHAALSTALNLPVETKQQLEGALENRTFPQASQSDLVKLALENRPEYARAGLAVESSQQQVRGARGEYLPRVDFFATFAGSGQGWTSGSADYSVGASLTLNIFDLGRGARIDQARAANAIASAEQEDLANRIRLEVVRANQQFIAARERIAVAARTIDQAAETLRIIQERYQAGLTTVTEVLRAETALVRSRLNLLSARYDHYVGYANILLATGRLNDVQAFTQ